MYKCSFYSLFSFTFLFSSISLANTLEWVEDNSENAEGIVTPDELKGQQQQRIINLSKVVVTGALKEELVIVESAASIAHFGVQDVDRLNATSLADLFAYEPGVTVDQNKAGGLGDIRIRGMGSDRVMIAIDGAPLPITYAFGSYISTTRNYFDIDAMKSIDIIKGPMSTLYGGSALSGGVFMQTKDPDDFIKEGNYLGGETKIGYRTANQEMLFSGTLAAHFTETVSGFVRYTYTNPQELRNYHGKAKSQHILGSDRTHPNRASTDTHNILTKVVFNPTATQRFSLSYEHFKETVNKTPLSNLNMTSFGTTFLKQHTRDDNKRQQVMLRHDFDAETLLFDRGFWHVYYQQNKARQWNTELRQARNGSLSVRDRYADFNNKSYGFSAEFTKNIEQSQSIYHNLTYGLNYRHSKVDSTRTGDTRALITGRSIEREAFPNKGFPDSNIKELGVFLQDRIGFLDGDLELIAGIRYDHYKLDPKSGTAYESANEGVLPPSSMSKGRVSKRFALLWHPTENNNLFFNYSEGFRAPSFSAVNVGFSNPSIGYISRSNPDLKPETSRTYELGWHYLDDSKSLSVTTFYTKYKNFIEELNMVGRDSNGYMVYQAINLDKSYIYGAEVKGSIDLFRMQNDLGVVSLNGSVAYAKGKEKSTKNPINSVEPLTAVIGVDYTYSDQLYLSARVKAVEAKREKDIYNNPDAGTKIGRSPGYATFDLIAEYKPVKDITINAGLYNIFNKKYWTWSDRMMATTQGAINRDTSPGFNMALSIKYEF